MSAPLLACARDLLGARVSLALPLDLREMRDLLTLLDEAERTARSTDATLTAAMAGIALMRLNQEQMARPAPVAAVEPQNVVRLPLRRAAHADHLHGDGGAA